MLEEKRNSTVLRQFWFVDVENTLPAIMVERVLCIYWDYSSISIFSSDLSSTVKWSSQTVIRSSQRFTRASSMYFSFRRILLMVLVCHFFPPAPVRIPSRSRPAAILYAVCFQTFCNPIHRVALQVFPVDALYHLCLFRIDDEIPICILGVAEEVIVIYLYLAILVAKLESQLHILTEGL